LLTRWQRNIADGVHRQEDGQAIRQIESAEEAHQLGLN
jgi:hypothetical protein